MSQKDDFAQRWPTKENEAVREYMVRATSGIGDIKNLTWRFLVANTAIAAFVIAHRVDIKGAYIFVVISCFLLSGVSIFIACYSFIKLKERRVELRKLYSGFEFIKYVRPDYLNVTRYDCGDWAFLISGIASPLLLFNIIYASISYHISIGIEAGTYWWTEFEKQCSVISIAIFVISVIGTCKYAQLVKQENLDLLEQRKTDDHSTTCRQKIVSYFKCST